MCGDSRFEGMTYDEIIGQYPDWSTTNFDFTDYGGESLEHMTKRVKSFSHTLYSENPINSTILVVGHGGCLRVLLCILLNKDLDKWWEIPNELASLTIVENVWQQPELIVLNDTSHLRV
jgi:broad specificity phosphatase PhoE